MSDEPKEEGLESREIALWVPFLPPTENHIRVHRRQGGTTYSSKAKHYQIQFAQYVRNEYLIPVSRFASNHTESSIYSLSLDFTFETVVNKGWYKNRAKTLYKRFDVGNRRKLIEDCIVNILGKKIDDCLFFELNLTKRMGPNTGVKIVLREINPKEYGVLNVNKLEHK